MSHTSLRPTSGFFCCFLASCLGLLSWQTTATAAQPAAQPGAKPVSAPSAPVAASPPAKSPAPAASPPAASAPAEAAKPAAEKAEPAKPVEAKAAEPEPKAAKPEAAAPKPEETKTSAKKPAAKLLDSRGQPASYTLLAHPSVADRLKLSDQQRARVAELMTERSEAMAKADSKDRPKVIEENETKLAGVLTDEQRLQWSKTPPEPLLRFNYRFQRWVDVLEEVAKQAGLSLVLEAPPPGTLNYSDTREYTATEAIDLLNGVLVTKGFTLVRREKMLVLVDLSEGIPEGLIPRVTLDELDTRGKFEMVSVLFPLKGRNAATVTAEITPLLGPRGKIVPLPTTGQLLLTDSAGIMKAISAVIESMPISSTPASTTPETPTVGVYRVKNADPAAALKVLQALLPTATFAVDPKTDQIHAYGGPTVQAAVKSLIEQIQANAPADKKPKLERYAIDESTGPELLKTIAAIVPEAKLSRDPHTGSLIAWAAPSEQEAIKGIVEKLGGDQGIAQSRQFQVYRLTKAAPATAMTLLQELFPHAKIAVDKPTGNLVVIGTLAEQKGVQSILEQLQTEKTGPDALELKAYPITTADAASTLATLKTLYPNLQIALDTKGQRLLVTAMAADQAAVKASLDQIQMPAPKGQQSRFESYRLRGADPTTLVANLQTLVPQAKVTADRTAGTLVVFGTPAEHEMVRGALEKLGHGQGVEDTPQVEVYRLSKVEPTTVLPTLQNLAPDAKLVVDAASKSVIAFAVPADQKAIRNVLEQLQSSKPAADSPQLRFYPLSQTPPTAMLTVLQALAPKAQVTLDAANRRLTVVATPEDHEVLKSAIEQVDKTVQAEEKRKLVAYAVNPSQRTRFQAIASGLTVELPGMQVMPNGEPSELMIWAKPSQHVVIADMLEQLKREVPTAEKYELVAYSIKAATPTSLLSVLKTLFPNAQITPDARARRLLIWALPADQQAIKAALEKIDAAKSADTQEKLMVYPVPYLDPTITVKTLQEALPEANIVSDVKAGTLVVWAAPWEHETIDKLLKQMQAGAESQNKPKLVVYPVGNGDSTAMLGVLQALVPRALVVADAKTRTIGATATPQDHELIASALEQMSKQEPPEKAYRLATYTIEAGRRGAISTLISILSEQYPQAKFTPGLERGHLFAWARPDDQKRIQATLNELTKNMPPPDLGYKLVIYTLESGGAVAVNNAVGILKSMFPDANVSAASEPGNLLVWARPQDHPRIAQIVKEVGKAESPETAPRLEVYTLQAASTLKGRLGQAPNLGAIAILKPMFPEAHISPGANPKDVVVLARPAEHVKIKAALAEVDKKEPPESAPRVVAYTLESTGPAGVTGAIGILQSLFPDAQFSAGTDPRSIVALARPDDHQAIQTTIAEISKKDSPETAYRLATYTIEAGRRGAISALISILSEQYPSAKFTPGLERGHLFAWARPDDQKRIQATLDELTKNMPPPDMGYKLVIYTLESGGSVAVNNALGILKSMFPDAYCSAGSDPGNLLAWARPQDHPRIAQIVKEVGKGAPPEAAPRIEVYTLRSAAPSKGRLAQAPNVGAVAVLKTLFPDAQFSPGTNANDVVALARPAEHVKIKAAVAELDKKEPPESAPRVVAYTLESAGPAGATGAIAILQTLFPDAQFSTGSEPGSIVALARPDDQQAIKTAIEEMSKKEPPDKAPSVATYRLQAIDATTAVTMFRTAFVDARFSAGIDGSTLVVWARPADQALIKKTITEIENTGGLNDQRVLSIYPFKSSDVTALSQLLDPAMRRGIQLVPDPVRNRLLVWADAKHQDVIKGVIEQFSRETAKTGEPTSQVYRFTWADPKAALTVLTTLVPNAQIALDPVSHSLVVSAMPEDHARIKATVAEMDRRDASGQTPRLEVYRFQASDPADAMPVLQGLFRLYPDVRLSLDTAGGAIVAVATPAQHETIRSLVEQVEKLAATEGGVSLQTYPLGEADGASTLRMLTPLLEKEGRKVHLSIEPYSNSLVAIARPEQHKTIQTTLERLQPEERTLEVFQLEVLDPTTAQLAVERLFGDGGFGFSSSDPTVDIDIATQQLLIRATAKQHLKIRELLVRMGETALGQPAGVDSRRSRHIPFDGDLNAAVEEIQRVWPQLRPNPIRVVAPPPEVQIRQRPPEQPMPSGKEPVRPAAGPKEAPSQQLPKNEILPAAPAKSDASPKPAQKAAAPEAAKPVIVVPGEGSVTITSDDPAALNQFETLLRAMSRQRGVVGRNYNVFLLRNAKAASVAATLQQVFRTMPGGAGRGYGLAAARGYSRGAASVVIVPDERLNAIVAYANRTDRLTIENLLKVLDTAEIPEPLAADRLQLIPIKNTGAEKIMRSLTTMFRSHVEGLSIEETTNSVVVMAAPETVEEIKRVANMLDEAAGGKASREVELVPLRKIKSEQVERALEIILRQPQQRARVRPSAGSSFVPAIPGHSAAPAHSATPTHAATPARPMPRPTSRR